MFARASAAVVGSTLAAASFVGAVNANSSAKLKEPATGIEFEAERNGKTLLGLGVRQKKLGGFISVNVYAVAAYVPLLAFKSARGHIDGNIENGLVVDKDFVIRMARHVESDVLSNALKESLQSRVPASSLLALDLLQNLIVSAASASKPPFSTGSQLVFSQRTVDASKLGCTIGVASNETSPIGHVTNCDLAHAFVRMYLGSDSVSPTLRSSAVQTAKSWN